ncbi:MAG: hypothetical protein C4521_01220 [Actinobacteria bacterium]|nr:MAG: hypothetical protein C4521_01220 [Actinomycetota bacterium]
MDRGEGRIVDEREVLRERALRLAKPQEVEEHGDLCKLLVLRLADEWYAVDVAQVREVLHGVEVTRVPCTPSYVLGIVSVRGEIVSVCDVKEALGLGLEPAAGNPPIVIVEIDDVVTGLAADDVAEIVEVPEASVEPALTSVDRFGAEYVSGESMIDGKLVAILNVERLVIQQGQ